MRHLILTISILGLILAGCEDNKANNDETTGIEVVTHDIDATDASGFYFNLSSGAETDSSSSRQLAFQMLSVSLG